MAQDLAARPFHFYKEPHTPAFVVFLQNEANFAPPQLPAGLDRGGVVRDLSRDELLQIVGRAGAGRSTSASAEHSGRIYLIWATSVATIRRAELTEREASMTAANDLAVRRALEFAGVEFIDENGGGPGVRLRKTAKGKSRK